MDHKMEHFQSLEVLAGKIEEASRLIQRLREKNIHLEEDLKQLKEEYGHLKNNQNFIKEKVHFLLQQFPVDKSQLLK